MLSRLVGKADNMQKCEQIRVSVQGFVLLILVLVLAGCASQSGPAPVTDRSVALERLPPVIAPAGGGPQTPPPASSGSGAVVSGASGTARPPQTASSGTATSGAGPTDSAATVGTARTSGVTVATGIGRTTIGSQPIPESARPDIPAQHTVARGDTLYSIAWMYNLDYRRLALANNLSPPYTIFPGQQLSLNERSVSETAVRSLPEIPAAPAGIASAPAAERPQASIDARRTGSVATREVDGVAWQWPADGRLMTNFSGSGSRGIDLGGSRGDPVYAAADGEVVYAGRGIQGAGNLVILRHSARHLSAYMHNSTVLVSEGARIRAGDKIAEIGSSPAGQDLLHFEIRVDGQAADPARFLPNR